MKNQKLLLSDILNFLYGLNVFKKVIIMDCSCHMFKGLKYGEPEDIINSKNEVIHINDDEIEIPTISVEFKIALMKARQAKEMT